MTSTNTTTAPDSREDQRIRPLAWSRLSEKKPHFLKIEEVHKMPDFLMNLVSPQDQWMYITSNGALTAGRVNSDNCLFPYYTHDKLIDLEATTGCLTRIRVHDQLWQPFAKDRTQSAAITRSLYKNREGNEIIFEEEHLTLGLQFSYLWTFSPRYGFVRQMELKNTGDQTVELELLDGLHNLVPYGLDQNFLNRFSNLADAYKKSELIQPEAIGVYYLSSIPTDRAEPSEGLKASIAWSLGYDPDQVLISDRQIAAFEDGKALVSEEESRGMRGAYLLTKTLTLAPNEQYAGCIVADINQDAGQIESLRQGLEAPSTLMENVQGDIDQGCRELESKLAAADAYQLTMDDKRCARHLSNVLYNIMRGGISYDGYQFPREDFLQHLQSINREVYDKHHQAIREFPESLPVGSLIEHAETMEDEDLLRISIEYLPLTFSRRHGDPSRPWNAFSIETTNAQGEPILAYQGNWRDIFQNWEALAYSFPEFISGMIFRFLNASTADGYNPYRLTKDGFDWELLEEDEPWSNIGYWGDHQIIYLLKLLEFANQVDPESLKQYLDKPLFVFADVPYRIAGFDRLWETPQDTVDFDYASQAELEKQAAELGADGKLRRTQSGSFIKASLLEKLLIPLLTKLSNLVPEGGIWMNTQRPEWNDANNALVGNGLSVVTLGYMHRYLDFMIQFLEDDKLPSEFDISEETALFIETLSAALEGNADLLSHTLSESERYKVTSELGKAGSDYRSRVYETDSHGKSQAIPLNQLIDFAKVAKRWIAHSLQANERQDGLYHSYNLLRKTKEGVAVDYLYEMLEGQVSILSAKLLTPDQAVQLLDSLRASAVYREDKGSYMLYPNRQLPSFLEKNILPVPQGEESELILHLLQNDPEKAIYRDSQGRLRFNGSFKNANDLRSYLNSHPELISSFTETDLQDLEAIFIETFNHQAFTGRSGTFFAYEGLGSIYWHMVSKLVLAIQENYGEAKQQEADTSVLKRLLHHYEESLGGLGIHQRPEEYGAFPSDAYSHTPTQSGVQQPGMTGQVKEDILIRWAELGVGISEGKIHFHPKTLKRIEFLNTPASFEHINLQGDKQSIDLNQGQLAFTYCQTPVVYTIAQEAQTTIHLHDGESQTSHGNVLSFEDSLSILQRSGTIQSIEVSIPEAWLC